MAENSSIEWTTHTFNPWTGCTKVAAGCANCYAESWSKRTGMTKWGPGGTRVRTSAANWRKPVKWNREAEFRSDPQRPRVFCASLADVFEDWQGPIMFPGRQPVYAGKDGRASSGPANRATMDDLRRDLFALIDATPYLDWLLLTKRPENIRRMWCSHVNTDGKPPSMLPRHNVWLLTSIAEQADAERNIPELLKCRDLAPVLGLSCEPLVGRVKLQSACPCPNGRQCVKDRITGHRIVQDSSEGGLWVECACSRLNGISWVICGGESGHHARPMHPDWARSLRDQCAAAGVPFFFKQWGEWEPWEGAGAPIRGDKESRRINDTGQDVTSIPELWCSDSNVTDAYVCRVGKKTAGRTLDGKLWDEFPKVQT